MGWHEWGVNSLSDEGALGDLVKHSVWAMLFQHACKYSPYLLAHLAKPWCEGVRRAGSCALVHAVQDASASEDDDGEAGAVRGAQARLAQLEAVLGDTEAELARLQGCKVASMVRVYQGEHNNP